MEPNDGFSSLLGIHQLDLSVDLEACVALAVIPIEWNIITIYSTACIMRHV